MFIGANLTFHSDMDQYTLMVILHLVQYLFNENGYGIAQRTPDEDQSQKLTLNLWLRSANESIMKPWIIHLISVSRDDDVL